MARPKRDATEEYRAKRHRIRALSALIESTLDGMLPEGDRADWGHVGTAAHIDELLMQAAVCLAAGNDSDEEETEEFINEQVAQLVGDMQ